MGFFNAGLDGQEAFFPAFLHVAHVLEVSASGSCHGSETTSYHRTRGCSSTLGDHDLRRQCKWPGRFPS